MGIREQRLYYDDGYLDAFTSEIAGVKERDGDTWVRLNASAFYPTSGGQPFDTGVLMVEGTNLSHDVTNVEVEDGQVWHKISGSVDIGQTVRGCIDWTRRFDFMQQHSGQHILSACFEEWMNASTSSFHMGDIYSSIDLDIAVLSDDDVQRVMLEANRWIWRDVPIRARFVSEHELPSLKLRKAPSVTEDIRIVTIEGLEDNACGGTHPSSTGQVGQILITKMERMRGGIRVTFVCGERALSTSKEAVDVLRTLAANLSVGNQDLQDTVDALQNQLKDNHRKYQVLRNQHASLLARDYATRQTKMISNTHVLVAEIPDLEEVQDLKRMAVSALEWLTTSYANEPQLIVFIGELGERTHMVVQATEDAVMSANALVKELLPKFDGKGGGNAMAAQGSAPVSSNVMVAEVETALMDGR